jgi:periplasmic protein TonB
MRAATAQGRIAAFALPFRSQTHLKMASVTTSEFIKTASPAVVSPFSLIEQKGLASRLVEELARASSELARDPRGFIRNLFANDAKDAKRRRRIQIGLACAVAAHVALIALIAFFGLRSLIRPKEEASNIKVEIVQFPVKSFDKPEDVPRGDKGGGGSGGDHSPSPASKGATPQMSPAPQIVKPLAPPAAAPALPMSPTISGPESAPPPVGVALGVPDGVPSEAPSPGPGEGDGTGGGKGSGAGKGKGAGTGNGEDGGIGDKGKLGLSTGLDAINNPIPFNRLKEIPGSSGITWIRRPTPVTTPEAQANKVKGEVWLRATFRADGTVTNIVVIREVPYMTESAIDALSRSKFRPATINGQPITLTNVPIRVNVTVE